MQPTTRDIQPATGHVPQPATNSLAVALGLHAKEHIALVGGGGKTSLLFSLAGEIRAHGKKVLTSTTTKVRRAEASQAEFVCFVAEKSWRETLRRELDNGRSVFLGFMPLESGKVQGVDPSLLDALYGEENLDCLLVEADGSAGHPVKAPSEHEPVIPCSTTAVIAVIGVEAIGAPMSPEIVFRAEPFERITGVQPGQTITALALSRLFDHQDGLFKGAPEDSRRMIFLNKADLPHDRKAVGELTRLVLDRTRRRVERVVLGSIRDGTYEAEYVEESG